MIKTQDNKTLLFTGSETIPFSRLVSWYENDKDETVFIVLDSSHENNKQSKFNTHIFQGEMTLLTKQTVVKHIDDAQSPHIEDIVDTIEKDEKLKGLFNNFVFTSSDRIPHVGVHHLHLVNSSIPLEHIHYICKKKPILQIHFKSHFPVRQLSIITKNDEDKQQVLNIFENYKIFEKCKQYLKYIKAIDDIILKLEPVHQKEIQTFKDKCIDQFCQAHKYQLLDENNLCHILVNHFLSVLKDVHDFAQNLCFHNLINFIDDKLEESEKIIQDCLQHSQHTNKVY